MANANLVTAGANMKLFNYLVGLNHALLKGLNQRIERAEAVRAEEQQQKHGMAGSAPWPQELELGNLP